MKTIKIFLFQDNEVVEIQGDEASDGYHTFDELYEHRCVLFLALLSARHDLGYAVYKTKPENGWFVAGTITNQGQIGYHLPERMFDFCPSNYEAPEWDGHTSNDAIERLMALI